MATIRSLVVLLAVVALVVGCAGTIDIHGGPNNGVHLQLKNDGLAHQLAPLVAGDTVAAQRAADLAARESRATILLYGEIGFVLLCGTTSYQEVSTAYVLGTCGAGIVLAIATIIIHPGRGDYGDVLRTYNANHPEGKFTSSELRVE